MGDLQLEFTRLVYASNNKPVASKNVYLDIQGDDKVEYQVFKTDENGNLITSDNKRNKVKIVLGEYSAFITDSPVQEGNQNIEGKDVFRDQKEMKVKIVKGVSLVEEKKKKAYLLEIEDVLYHHDSGVILPSQPEGPSSSDGADPSKESTQITGITVTQAIYLYLQENPDKKIIIAGHTDTTGSPRYNFELSKYRALSVMYLLLGDKQKWAINSNEKHKVEDYQQILTHYAKLWGWNCDPGGIDNIHGPKTDEAVKNFQTTYNAEFNQNIGVDGRVGLQTWGAIYDCYVKELADRMGTDQNSLGEYRKNVKFVSDDYKILACGESYPIEEKNKDNYRSQINRRVEVIFFDPGEEPDIKCPNPYGPYNNETCDLNKCPIYKENEYDFEYIHPVYGVTVFIKAEDGKSPPSKLVLLGKEEKYKAVVNPPGGTIKWKLSDDKASIVGPDNTEIVTIKGEKMSTELDDLTLSVEYTSDGKKAISSWNLSVIRLWLDVDADRDGVVEENGEGKNTWEWGKVEKGAVVLINNDNDNPKTNTVIDNENNVVDATKDVDDLSPLVIRSIGPPSLPTGYKLVLKVTDKDKIRIFDGQSASATAIIGPKALPEEKEVPVQKKDLVYGMEGICYPGFPDDSFDGIISISLHLIDATDKTKDQDDVKVRVSPWLMPHHLAQAEIVYVVNIPGDNKKFVKTIENTLPGTVKYEKLKGHLYGNDRWVQDCVEIGYSKMASQSFNVAFDPPRHRGLRAFPRKLLGPDFGYVKVADLGHSVNSLDSMGNLEVSPPVGKYKFGRIIYGGSTLPPGFTAPSGFDLPPSDREMDPKVRAWLDAQVVQKPLSIFSNWLVVGHVDEFISFVPANGGKGFKMLIASPRKAKEIMEDLVKKGKGSSNCFDGCSTANRKVIEILNNKPAGAPKMYPQNDNVQVLLDKIRAQLVSELELDDSNDVIEIPVLFQNFVNRAGVTMSHYYVAYTGDIVNMLVVGNNCYPPKPFGPKVGKVDHFEKYVRDTLSPLGLTINWVDDWDSYHKLDGEVHCGTNTKRKIIATDNWWEFEGP